MQDLYAVAAWLFRDISDEAIAGVFATQVRYDTSYAFSISRLLPGHGVAHTASLHVLSFTRVFLTKSSCGFAKTMVLCSCFSC